MKQKQSPYPFVIMNTEMAGEEGEQQWSFLDLDPPEQLFLFNSVGLTCFKDFIINKIMKSLKQVNQKNINKILYGINDFNKTDNVKYCYYQILFH